MAVGGEGKGGLPARGRWGGRHCPGGQAGGAATGETVLVVRFLTEVVKYAGQEPQFVKKKTL